MKKKSLSPKKRAARLVTMVSVPPTPEDGEGTDIVEAFGIAGRYSPCIGGTALAMARREVAKALRLAEARGRRLALREAAEGLRDASSEGGSMSESDAIASRAFHYAADHLDALAAPVRRKCVCDETSMRNCPAHQAEWNAPRHIPPMCKWTDEDTGHGCIGIAEWTTCDPIGGIVCTKHKCRCSKPLPVAP